MIYFLKCLKGIAYFLAMLILFQSCIAYNKTSSSIEEASSEEDMPIKITTKDGSEHKLNWIEEKDDNIVCIKNVEREYYYKKDIIQYTILNPEHQTVPLELAVKHHGTILLFTKDDKDRYDTHEFIRISENDERITGYKMTGKDTLTVIIPIDQIEKIQLKDKGKSGGRTAGLTIGVIGVGLVVLIAIEISNSDFW